jgi:hypothetical protein
METIGSSTTAGHVSAARQPRFAGMSHVSLPCRDLHKSKIFYSQILGGELVHEILGFVDYKSRTSSSDSRSRPVAGRS